MFVLSFVWERRWFLQFRDRAYDRESSAAEIAQLFGPDAVPQPPAWRRFGMMLAVSKAASDISS